MYWGGGVESGFKYYVVFARSLTTVPIGKFSIFGCSGRQAGWMYFENLTASFITRIAMSASHFTSFIPNFQPGLTRISLTSRVVEFCSTTLETSLRPRRMTISAAANAKLKYAVCSVQRWRRAYSLSEFHRKRNFLGRRDTKPLRTATLHASSYFHRQFDCKRPLHKKFRRTWNWRAVRAVPRSCNFSQWSASFAESLRCRTYQLPCYRRCIHYRPTKVQPRL